MSKYINADDYKELIEREKAECYPTYDEFEDGCKTGLGIAVEVIDEMSPADVVEVVRCKDCKYYIKHSFFDKAYYTCDRAEDYMCGDTIGVSFQPDADFFCADGERKETE